MILSCLLSSPAERVNFVWPDSLGTLPLQAVLDFTLPTAVRKKSNEWRALISNDIPAVRGVLYESNYELIESFSLPWKFKQRLIGF